MKKRKVWKYFCEFCGKGNCNPSYMSRHEKHCTMNPNRTCRMCARVGDKQVSMPELIAAITYSAVPGFEEYTVVDVLGGSKIGVPAMKEQRINILGAIAHNCPACMLAAMRQASEPDDGVFVSSNGWNWTIERKAWMDDYRASLETDSSSDLVFVREYWDEYRAKRYKC